MKLNKKVFLFMTFVAIAIFSYPKHVLNIQGQFKFVQQTERIRKLYFKLRTGTNLYYFINVKINKRMCSDN